jgi:hypothetical protein
VNRYNKLHAVVNGLLDIGSIDEMFAPAEVTPEDQEIITRLEKTLEQVTRLVGETVRNDELVALKKMRRGNLDLNVQRIELLTQHLGKAKKALTASAMKHEALELAG